MMRLRRVRLRGRRDAGWPPPPQNVRAFMPDGRIVPIECRYAGWNGEAHVWRAVWVLPGPPARILAAQVPPLTSIEMAVKHDD